MRDGTLLQLIGCALAHPYRNSGVTKVVAPEARGPICGALVALELRAGLVLARKSERNHPGADLRATSQPTWRGHSEEFRARSFDLGPADRVVVVDDWITTGNSIRAVRGLIERCTATTVGTAVIVNKASAATLDELQVHALVNFDQLVGP